MNLAEEKQQKDASASVEKSEIASGQFQQPEDNEGEQNKNENEQEEEEANENLDPLEVNAKPKVEIEPQSDLNTNNSQGLLRRLISCRCTRGKEIQAEQLNELNLAEEMETKPDQPKKNQKTYPLIIKFDRFLQSLTPWYMILLYYLIFFTTIGLCLQLYLNDELRLVYQIFAGLFIFNHIVKIVFKSMLEDEWQDELPYLDTNFGNKARIFFIYFLALCNLDINYWLKLIYHNNKRDSIIEHMFALCRLIDVITFNAPIMLLSLYIQFCDTSSFQLPFMVIALLNMLMIVNAFMHLNFFDGSAYASIRWSFIYLCELYVRTILVVACFVLLQNFNIAECMIGVLVFIALFQAIFFLAYEGFFSMLFGFLFYLYKTVLIFKFREYSFGNKQLDCDAQPGIVNQNKNINQMSYSLIQQLLNLVISTNLIFALLLFGAYPLIVNDEILFYSFIAGAVCYGIQVCHNLHTLKQRLFYEEYFS